MSRDYIPKALRERVSAQAGHRCGYCLTSSLLAGSLRAVGYTFKLRTKGQGQSSGFNSGQEALRCLRTRYSPTQENEVLTWASPALEPLITYSFQVLSPLRARRTPVKTTAPEPVRKFLG